MRDSISLAYSEYQIEINTSNNTSFWDFLKNKDYITDEGIVKVENLTGETLNLGNGSGTTDVYKIERQDDTYTLKYYENDETSELLWQVNEKTGEINWDNILADANSNPEKYKHPDQSDTNGDIGIGADGNPVNMDKWDYITDNNTIRLAGQLIGGYGAGSKVPSYSYEYDDEGNIITDIICPQYIKIDGTDEFYPVTYIGEYAFYYCTELTSVVIPDIVTGIGLNAFEECSGLTSIIIPDSVTSIDDSAFLGCTSLTNLVIPDSVTSIGRYAFSGCSSLTSLVIPNSVKSIGSSAFTGCSRLKEVTIQEGLTTIEGYTFRSCTDLSTIAIPRSVTSIGANAFYECSSLSEVTYNGTMEQWKAITINDDGNEALSNAIIHCTNGDITPSA